MRQLAPWVVTLSCLLALATTADAQQQQRRKTITAGGVTFDPAYVIACFRPIDQQAVALYVGRPGHAIQSIVVRDTREAAALFNEIWANDTICKPPGEANDPRPLTRLRPVDDNRRTPALVVNLDRVLAIAFDPTNRLARVYFDKLVTDTLTDPNSGEWLDHLVIRNVREEADAVVAAYKVCVHAR